MRIRHWTFIALLLSLTAASPCRAADASVPQSQEEFSDPRQAARLIGALDRAIRAGRHLEAHGLVRQIDRFEELERAPAVQLLKAELAIAEQREDLAAAALQRLGPGEGGCRVNVAFAWLDNVQRRHDAAVQRLQRAADICPDQLSIWQQLAANQFARGNVEGTVNALRHAIAIRPDDPQLANALAVALTEAGHVEEAVALLDQTVRMAPGPKTGWLNRDMASAMAGEPPTRDPSDTTARWSERLEAGGDGALASGRTDMARSLFAQAALLRERMDSVLWKKLSDLGSRE
jgi:tetratricopeptide (TPR) repeat protein